MSHYKTVGKWHLTFRLYMTVWAGNRAMRSIDPCPNCGWRFAWEWRSHDL